MNNEPSQTPNDAITPVREAVPAPAPAPARINRTKHHQYSLAENELTKADQKALARAGISFRKAQGLDKDGKQVAGWVVMASGRAQRRAAGSILKPPRVRFEHCKPSGTVTSPPKATEGEAYQCSSAQRNAAKRRRQGRA
jgi:hypothetical protein